MVVSCSNGKNSCTTAWRVARRYGDFVLIVWLWMERRRGDGVRGRCGDGMTTDGGSPTAGWHRMHRFAWFVWAGESETRPYETNPIKPTTPGPSLERRGV